MKEIEEINLDELMAELDEVSDEDTMSEDSVYEDEDPFAKLEDALEEKRTSRILVNQLVRDRLISKN